MKKIFWMLCSMTVLFAAGCESDKTEDEGPVGEARITSFVFSAEKNADVLIKKMDLFGSDPKSLYMLDSELAARVYTAPSLVL